MPGDADHQNGQTASAKPNANFLPNVSSSRFLSFGRASGGLRACDARDQRGQVNQGAGTVARDDAAGRKTPAARAGTGSDDVALRYARVPIQGVERYADG